MFAYGIFKVLYAPHKVFKEISQNPKYIGPIIIMILFAVANVGSTYTVVSKTYIEETLPMARQLDEWTENANLWKSNGSPTENYTDFIEGTIYGNKSIEFSAVNTTIRMLLDNIGPVNCSDPSGYKNLYLRIKWTSPSVPENATIHLYSTNPSEHSYYNLTRDISDATVNVWNNFTIELANQNWTDIGTGADWGNITGLELEFTWPTSSNITVLVDGLFFGGLFKPPVEDVVGYMVNFSIFAFMQFVIRWVFLGGVIYIMTKAFKANTVWRVILILVGFALITMFIQAVINAAAFSTLPTIRYPFELIGGVEGESENAYNKILEETWLVNQIYGYVQIAVLIWTIALCTIAVRLTAEFSWTKSLLIAAVAYFAATFVEGFLVGG
ncbi:MAG: Yip1 family protein [Candidatus Bathycorpusculaceae bacterium]